MKHGMYTLTVICLIFALLLTGCVKNAVKPPGRTIPVPSREPKRPERRKYTRTTTPKHRTTKPPAAPGKASTAST